MTDLNKLIEANRKSGEIGQEDLATQITSPDPSEEMPCARPGAARRTVVCFALSLVLAGEVVSQARHEIPSELLCPACSIEASHVVTLYDPDGSTSPQLIASVAVDSEDRYYVTPLFSRGEVAVYDATGRLAKVVGRSGDGPGEFRLPVLVGVDGFDSVHVFEPTRRSIFTPGAESFSRLTNHHEVVVQQALTLRNGDDIVQNVRALNLAEPLHLIESTSGTVVRSFGAAEPEPIETRTPLGFYRQIAEGSAGVWVARTNRYYVERWTRTGELALVLSRAVNWFKPWDGVWSHPYRFRPEPRLRAIWEDEQGRVWIVVQVAAIDWKAADVGARREYALHPDSLAAMGQTFVGPYDTIVEVLDPVAGRVIVSQRFPENFQGSVGRGRVREAKLAPDGDIQIVIWELSLKGAP